MSAPGAGKIIISLCDVSGVWSEPYLQAGYEVHRIDIKSGRDLRLWAWPGRVHGILAAPPCTAFSRAGAQYWKRKDESGDTLEGLAVVDACLRYVAVCSPAWWVLENPIGRLKHWLGPPQFSFNPCWYGDAYTKRTWLWGKFVPPAALFSGRVVAVEPKGGREFCEGYRGSLEGRQAARSKTPAGFARCFFDANP